MPPSHWTYTTALNDEKKSQHEKAAKLYYIYTSEDFKRKEMALGAVIALTQGKGYQLSSLTIIQSS